MNSSDLNFEQLRRLRISLEPKLRYLQKLVNRMQQQRFPETDRMLRDAAIAEAATRSLLAEVTTRMVQRREFDEAFR